MRHALIKEIQILDDGIESSLPGFPSYYTTINEAMKIIKYFSLIMLIILLIYTIIDAANYKKINKKLIIIDIIILIIIILASFIRMPYWT